MKARLLLFSIPAALMLTACQPATTELTDEQKAAAEVEIGAVIEEARQSILDVDVERHLNIYENSDDFTVAMYGDVYRTWSAWADMVRSGFSQILTVESCDVSDAVVQVLTADVAVYTSDLLCSGTVSEDGPVMPLIDHTITAVMVKRDDVWKIVNFSETYPQAESEG